jgi:hypothetical protein
MSLERETIFEDSHREGEELKAIQELLKQSLHLQRQALTILDSILEALTVPRPKATQLVLTIGPPTSQV